MIKSRLGMAMTFLVAGLGLAGGIAFAATVFNKTLDGSVNIVANANFAYYSDAAATQQITTVTVGDVSPGATKTFTIYIKNTSSVTETVSAGANTVASNVGTLTLTFDGAATDTLAPNAISKVVGTFVADDDATGGTKTFTLSVNATTATSTTTPPPTGTGVSYSATIQPIMTASCVSCHSWAGSYSGVVSRVVPGNASGSTLYQRVSSSTSTSGHMPPGSSLTSTQIQNIADWINQGAQNN